MSAHLTGPIALEITRRLTEALAPTHLQVIDDSEKHRGHGGYNRESGESHFTVEIESPNFAGMSRVGASGQSITRSPTCWWSASTPSRSRRGRRANDAGLAAVAHSR
jgi:stress-induced morphogen